MTFVTKSYSEITDSIVSRITKGIVKESGFFLFKTAKGLYPYEVMTDIKNKVNA